MNLRRVAAVGIWSDFDIEEFWEQSEHATNEYVSAPLADDVVAAVERELGYKLPAAYVELLRFQNGGIPCRRNHYSPAYSNFPDVYIGICGIYSIGGDKPNSLLGEFGSRFWEREWLYPHIGVYFADTPSGGHDMVGLDYRACGPTGEPQVVHVDQEDDWKIVVLAEDFETFIRGLIDDSIYEWEDRLT
ncbi:SMI1/KNR4 family protein [bacterium]|nr:SMI1/KNR4 family protein [bacterium]